MPPSSPRRVLCVAAPNWYGVPRLLGVLHKAGCRTTLIARPGSHAARSRHAHELIAGTWEPSENLALLKEHLAANPGRYDWVLLGDDLMLAEGVKHRGEAWLKGWFPVDPFSEKAAALAFKTELANVLAASGVPMPAWAAAKTPAEVPAAAERVGFPVMIKPSRGYAGNGVFKAEDAAALARELARPERAGADFLVQRFIPGAVGGTVALFDHGRPVCWFSSVTVATWPGRYGPSCVRRKADPPGVEDMLVRLGAALGFHGLGEAEWVLPAGGGPPLVIEFNGRSVAYLDLAPLMGADLPGAISAMLAGEPPRPRPPSRSEERPIRLFPNDLDRAVSTGDWALCARWLTGLAGPTNVPWGDPWLLRSYVGVVARALQERLFSSLSSREKIGKVKRPTT